MRSKADECTPETRTVDVRGTAIFCWRVTASRDGKHSASWTSCNDPSTSITSGWHLPPTPQGDLVRLRAGPDHRNHNLGQLDDKLASTSAFRRVDIIFCPTGEAMCPADRTTTPLPDGAFAPF